MKAVLTDARFSDPDWIFERKLDGIRCIAIRVRRARAAALAQRPVAQRALPRARRPRSRPRRCERFAIDGEVVAFDGAQTSFARLAQRGHARRPGVPLRVRHPLARRPGRPRAAAADAQAAAARRARLRRRRAARRRTATRTGEALFAEACRKGWEGVIAKRADSPYRATRSQGLAEVQVRARPGARDRRLHGAEGLAHRVRRAAARLLRRRRVPLRRQGRDRLRPRDAARPRRPAARARAATTRRSPTPGRSASAASPGSSPSSSPRSAFTEWTGAGRLRHPRFLGLRDDKAAGEVVREG